MSFIAMLKRRGRLPSLLQEASQSLPSHCFVDADYAGSKLTRRSQTGIMLLFVNRAPVVWYSKRQNLALVTQLDSEKWSMRLCLTISRKQPLRAYITTLDRSY